MRRTRGKEKRRGFAEDAPHGEDAPGDDAVDAARQHRRADRAPLARAEGERALAIALRHGFEALLRRAHDGRQVHNHERQRARDERGLQPQHLAEASPPRIR